MSPGARALEGQLARIEPAVGFRVRSLGDLRNHRATVQPRLCMPTTTSTSMAPGPRQAPFSSGLQFTKSLSFKLVPKSETFKPGPAPGKLEALAAVSRWRPGPAGPA